MNDTHLPTGKNPAADFDRLTEDFPTMAKTIAGWRY